MENPRGPTDYTLYMLEGRGVFETVRDNFRTLGLAFSRLPKGTIDPRELELARRERLNFIKSSALHGLVIVVIFVAPLLFMKKKVEAKKSAVMTIDISDYNIITNPDNKPMGGGGGGGDRDKLAAPKGKLPKLAMEQYAPPAVIVRNENPKLAVEPTVIIPPNITIPQPPMPNLGDPMAQVGPPSNGTGSGGGIGSGSGGGVGSGDGPGVGPGRGGGIGGGIFRVGGGVSAPVCKVCPDPEYSEQGRKSKHQGKVILHLIVGPDGRPHDIQIVSSLGMGLDEKAVEAVRNWRFEPSIRNGQPVAVQIDIIVEFKLY